MKSVPMKNDILTIAVIVFFVGVLISSIGFSNPFESAETQEAPSALHQGIVAQR